jgi:hypothetical protein
VPANIAKIGQNTIIANKSVLSALLAWGSTGDHKWGIPWDKTFQSDTGIFLMNRPWPHYRRHWFGLKGIRMISPRQFAAKAERFSHPRLGRESKQFVRPTGKDLRPTAAANIKNRLEITIKIVTTCGSAN